jgi:Flp pilus assembly pilin Flp
MFMLFPFVLWFKAAASVAARRITRSERGQATAEYALVLLGAAAVAVLVIGWAAKSGKIGELLNAVFDTVTRKVK